jgi:tetratricopeptide (TPR) repeat protein
MCPAWSRRWSLAALVATGAVSLAPPPAALAQGRYQPQGAAQRHYAEGERLLAAADAARTGGDAAAAEARTREAADAFEKAIEADAAYVDAYAKFGLTTYSTGQSDRAIARLGPAVQRAPESPELAFWLGNHLLRAGRAAEGLPHLERVARQAEAFPEASLVLGTHYYKAGDLPRAQTALETYLRVRPDDVQARGTLGNAYFKAEKYPEALRAFEDVRRASPDNIQVQINLGTCHFQLGNYEKAVELLTDALRREPKRESVVFNLGQAYFQWKKYAEAAAQFRTFVAMKPDGFNGHYFLGSALFELGPTKDAEALASLGQAVRLKGDVAIVHYKIGLIHLRRGALDEAQKALDVARRLAPTDAWVASALGTLARKRGQWDAAATLHEQAVDGAPDKARLQANLALTRAGRKQWPEAEAAATRALALDATDGFVRDAAAHVLAGAARARLSNGDAAGAETLLRQAVAAAPGTALLRANLAVALQAAGRFAEAQAEVEAAARLAPADPSVQISRGRVLLAAGKPAEARTAVESVPAAAQAPAGLAVLGAAALRAGDPEAAVRALEAAVRAVPTDAVSARNLTVAHLSRAARELRDANGGAAGAEALKAALRNEDALDVGLAHRARYLALLLALRRGDAGAAATWQQKLAAADKGDARAAPWLASAPPGHLDYLAAFTALLNRREDRAVALLEGSKALRNKGGAEARVLRRAYERLAEKAWTGGAFGEAAKHLKAAAALGRDTVVDHNLLAVELRTNRKAKLEARFRALTGGVPEAWFNLGVVLEAQGRHEDAFKAFLRAGQLGGPHAARARDLAEAKRRIFGFAP